MEGGGENENPGQKPNEDKEKGDEKEGTLLVFRRSFFHQRIFP
jgi:hypothetical protein